MWYLSNGVAALMPICLNMERTKGAIQSWVQQFISLFVVMMDQLIHHTDDGANLFEHE
jgi:hypothetical protein